MNPSDDTLLYFNELPKLHVENKKKTSQFPMLQNSHKICCVWTVCERICIYQDW